MLFGLTTSERFAEKRMNRKIEKLNIQDINMTYITKCFVKVKLVNQEIVLIFVIFLITMAIAYVFLSKSRIGNLKREELFHVPKRLFTVAIIAYTMTAFLIYIYGISSIAHFSAEQFVNATVIVSTFAVIGAIAVDMVK